MQVATRVPWPLKETFSELSPMSVIEKVTKTGSIWAYPTKGIKKLIMITKWTKNNGIYSDSKMVSRTRIMSQ